VERSGPFQADVFDVGGIVIEHSGLNGSPAGSIGVLDLATRAVQHLRTLVGSGTL
jgi:hypothetical protein